MLACQLGDYNITKILVEAGADPNARNKDGLTALDLAVKEKRAEVVPILQSLLPEPEEVIEPEEGKEEEAILPPRQRPNRLLSKQTFRLLFHLHFQLKPNRQRDCFP